MDRDNKEREFKDGRENEVLRRIPRLAENQVQFLKDTVQEFTKLFIILVNDVDVRNIPLLQELLIRIIMRLHSEHLIIMFLSFLNSSLTDSFFRSHNTQMSTFEYQALTICDKLKSVNNYWVRLDCRPSLELQRGILKIVREPNVFSSPVLSAAKPLTFPDADPVRSNNSDTRPTYKGREHLFDTSCATLPVPLTDTSEKELEINNNYNLLPSRFPQLPLYPTGIFGRGSPHRIHADTGNQSVPANRLPTHNGIVYDQLYGVGRMFDIQPYSSLCITPVNPASARFITRAFIPAGYNLSSSLTTFNGPLQMLPSVEIAQILSEGRINIIYDDEIIDNLPIIYRSSTVNPSATSSSSSSNPYANIAHSDHFSRFNQVNEHRPSQNILQDPGNPYSSPASSLSGLNFLNQNFPTNVTPQHEKTERLIPIYHADPVLEHSSPTVSSSSTETALITKEVDPARMEDPQATPTTPTTPGYRPRVAGEPRRTARMTTGKRKFKSPAGMKATDKRLLKRRCERLQVRLADLQPNWGQEWVSVKKRFAKLLDIPLVGERLVKINIEKLIKFVGELESIPTNERTESRDHFTEQLSIIEAESSPSTSSMESSPGPSPLSQTIASSTSSSTPPPVSQASPSSFEADNKHVGPEVSGHLQQFYDLKIDWPIEAIQDVVSRIDLLRPEATSAWLEKLILATPEQRQEQLNSFMQTFMLIDTVSIMKPDDPSSLGFR